MKFLADMGISPRTVAFLRSQGHDAVHLRDQGLKRLHDSSILQKARKEGRILLTHDLDFGELLAAAGTALPSVILFRLQNMRPERVNDYLETIISRYAESLQTGAIASVSERQIRIRHLPIKPA